ncbi:TadE/TadG family type IV pilus assembly protein [Streptomyces cinereoruber]|uniref:TadE/TadG family type IV pilus assembly protein n=1 Tax=Streptomyces cinereoruber TaxID=67260 RepID=UPI003EB79614
MSRQPRARARATDERRPARARATHARPRLGRARDRGQAAVEYLGFLPILLLVGLAGLQLGVAAYAAQQAGTAARAAARAATSDAEERPDATAAGYAAADWVTGVDVGRGGGEAVATVTVRIPSVVPFWTFDDVKKTATMPMPDEEDLP